MMLLTIFVVLFLVCCMLEVRCGLTGEVSGLQHTTNQEQNYQYGKQHHSRELLMMGILLPETC